MVSKPAASAASTTSTIVAPKRRAPPSQAVEAMCKPSFTAILHLLIVFHLLIIFILHSSDHPDFGAKAPPEGIGSGRRRPRRWARPPGIPCPVSLPSPGLPGTEPPSGDDLALLGRTKRQCRRRRCQSPDSPACSP